MKIKNYEKYLDVYYEDCELRKRLSGKTLKAYKIDMQQFFCFVGKGSMDTKRMYDYIHFLNEKYPKHKTVKRKLASVKAFYAYLEYEEIIEYTPFRKIRTQIKEPQLLPRTIALEQLEQLLLHLYNTIKKATSEYQRNHAMRNVAIIELLFATGMRISEICNLHWRNIDLEEQTVKILGKGSKERILYIGNACVINVLKQYYDTNKEQIEREGYFFLNKYKKRISEQSVRILLYKLEKDLNMHTHITPHMFRHTFATMLLDNDVDIRYIQKILGHSSISITQIYTHVSTAKQKEILSLKNPRNHIEI